MREICRSCRGSRSGRGPDHAPAAYPTCAHCTHEEVHNCLDCNGFGVDPADCEVICFSCRGRGWVH
ncbi:hypothetical protein ACIP5Y_11075 [Nocardia sp. NPDC088792]|uniref:hypothetical protein n=1 Tax=Nocardia sp. NPDC088792 TaxID=3364332 RepID=UPI0037FB1A12